jgi:WD40 repeat protein
MEAALTALEAAYRMGARSNPLRFMLARARESREAELATLGPHAGQVWYATFSPDGARVLTGGYDAVVRLWDAATGRELHALGDHVPPALAVWSPSGEVATADASGTIRLWTPDGRPGATMTGTRSAVTQIAFTRDGARCGSAGADGTVAIWDARSGARHGLWKAHAEGVDSLEFDPSGERVVTSGRAFRPGPPNAVIVWSIQGQELARLEGHTDAVWRAVFDPTGERVITASLDKTARVWDSRSGKQIHQLIGHQDRVTYVAVDEHGRRVATASGDTTVRVWSLDTGDLLATLHGHTAQVNAVTFAPDDQLVSVSGDGTARVWDLAHRIQTAAYHHGGFVWRAALDPDARRLATASWSGTAKIWDLRRQSRLQTYAAPVARAGADGDELLRSMVEGGRLARIGTRGIAAWDLASSRRWTWSAPAIVEGALSPDGRTAVAVDDQGDLHVIDGSGNVQHRFRGPGPGATSIAVYPDGRRAVTCGPGGRVAVWELATGRLLGGRQLGAVNWSILSRDGTAMFVFDIGQGFEPKTTGWLVAGDLSREIRIEPDAHVNDATFSPDGALLATLGQDGAVRIWNRGGRLEATLPHAGPVFSAAWSSDSSWLATGTGGGTLTIWDRSSWRARKKIEAHISMIRALAIDDRDTLIASAGRDGSVKIWDVELAMQVARMPAGETVSHLAFDRDRLLVTGPLATHAWRCDRYDRH